MRGLFIESTRSGYNPKQCRTTFTIEELIKFLEEVKDDYGNMPVYLYNDNGYTYGEITDYSIHVGEYSDEHGIEFEKD